MYLSLFCPVKTYTHALIFFKEEANVKSITLKINGVQHQFIIEEDMVLLDLLREDLKLTGTKQGCDRKGQCGACTVIVNGKTVLSCLTKVANLDGAEVITVEGLGTPDNPHLIQEAFVLSGAIQCGYCTPGLIMATKALLDNNLNPTRDEIRRAFRGHLCRCTGYGKIIEAVELAGRFLRGETTPEAVRPEPNGKQIGVSHPRPWSMLKACGLAPFAADIVMPGSLELAVVANPHHNARIKKIDYTKAAKMPGVVGIMTVKDIKGNNAVSKDKKLLYGEGDVAPLLGAHIAIVAANTHKEALAAAEKIMVDYEVLPRISNPKEALVPNAAEVQPGTSNICMLRRQIKGDAKKALSQSAAVVEAEFNTQWIHQAPLEPETAVAYLDGKGRDAQLVVIGRSLRIHDHAKALKEALGWENLRYQEAFTGGQFGIKVDLTSEQIAGAAALHFKKPVRYIPGTRESIQMTSKRHPFSMKVRLGADTKGKLTGYEIDATVEKGAFSAAAGVIVQRALAMLSGGYNIPNVSAEIRAVFTNNIWGGAARGAGPPQVNYALESAMDLLAAKVSLDPLAFRQLNVLKPGESTSSGHVMEEWALDSCLKRIETEYKRALEEATASESDGLRRGVGLAASSFGIGEPLDKSDVAVELDSDGGLTVYASVADPGEGNDSMLTQIAAHLTKIPMNKIRLVTRDSALTPRSAISAGSRQTFLSGHALVKAIEALQTAMKEAGAKTHADLVKAGRPTRYQARHSFTHTGMDKETGQGEFFISRCHGVQMAEVEVNTKTGEVRVLRMTGVVDAGTIINPLNVICQIEGGMDMGAGMALREKYVHGETVDWVTYKYPTFKTAFDKEVILLETPRKNGPLGATGVGEFTLMPTSPSITNAIENAIGVRIYDLPATPDKILKALKDKRA
jgi:aldehyde oxidoreductase